MDLEELFLVFFFPQRDIFTIIQVSYHKFIYWKNNYTVKEKRIACQLGGLLTHSVKIEYHRQNEKTS